MLDQHRLGQRGGRKKKQEKDGADKPHSALIAWKICLRLSR